MFKLSLSFADPGQGANPQRGFPAPGTGTQTTGAPSQPRTSPGVRSPLCPTKGSRSFFGINIGANPQRGFPEAENAFQQRPPGSMPNHPVAYGGNIEVYTPYYDRGAAAFVQNYGKVLTNPIGAGIAVNSRPSASYGAAGQYINGAIWWTSQAVPTSIGLQGLTSPQILGALLGRMSVQGVVRTV
jgi:hypothetical protein